MWEQIAGGALTAGLNLYSAGQAQHASAAAAEAQRSWAQSMAMNAHRYEVEDLRRAGLNPILSATGGRGAVVGSGASSQGVDARAGDAFNQGASAVEQRKLIDQQRQTEHYRTQGEKHRAEDARNQADISDLEASIARKMKRGERTEDLGQGAEAEYQRRKADAQAGATASQIERELDEAAGELTRSLRRLGISGGTATQLLNLMRERRPAAPSRR